MPHGIRNTEGRQDMSKSKGAGDGAKPGEGEGTASGGGDNPGAGQGTADDAGNRKWEARSKENKTALDALTGRLDALESSNGALAQKLTAQDERDAHAALVAKVAEESGVPASALRGTTEDELTAHAESLKEIMPSAPVIPGQGDNPANPGDDELREFTRNLFDTED